jgi:hypothetical protein
VGDPYFPTPHEYRPLRGSGRRVRAQETPGYSDGDKVTEDRVVYARRPRALSFAVALAIVAMVIVAVAYFAIAS